MTYLEPLPDPLMDFRKFLYLTWQFLKLPPPTPVQYQIADYLQNGPRRKIIEAFRGVGKSWITSAYVVWRLRIDPQLNFLVVSASKSRADDFSTFTLRLIYEMSILNCLIPSSAQRESKISFDVNPAEPDHAPSVKSVGIFGQLAGSRADEIIADDVEVPNNSFTQTMRDKLSEAVKEFDAILKPSGIITYLGTPQTEMTLYDVLSERGYKKRIWPARYPTEKLQKRQGESLAPKILKTVQENQELIWRPTDPRRFNETDLLEREASYGKSGFALQFMLDPTLSDGNRYPLKLSDLLVMNLNEKKAPEKLIWSAGPEYVLSDLPCTGLGGDRYYRPAWIAGDWLNYQGSIMSIDPSGRGRDETAYAVVKNLNGQLFVTDAGGVRGGYSDEALSTLCQIAKKQKINRIIIESNFGDGMFLQLLKPFLQKIYPCTCDEVRHSVQKERRIIDTLEPVMNQHKLVVCRTVIENDLISSKDVPSAQALQYQLFYQMSRLTPERGALRHDDRLDALAIAVNWWTAELGKDVDQQIQRRKDAALQRELDVFLGINKEPLDSLALGFPRRNRITGQRFFKSR